MPLSFERSPLWQRTLADCPADRDCVPRQSLRLAYLQFRDAVAPLAAEISRSLPMFTDHSIAHADALWDTASLICGDSFELNPAEAFVLGGAFLLHDVGMGLASYLGGTAAIEADPHFADLLASATARLRRADPSASSQAIESAARQESVAELLRLRHAAQAENLVTTTFQTSDGEPFYLLGDVPLRQTFGSLIGRIAHSHWWPVNDLRTFDWRQGSCPDHPPAWEVDPLKKQIGSTGSRRPGRLAHRAPGGLAARGGNDGVDEPQRREDTVFHVRRPSAHPPDNALLLLINPQWLFPEEVLARPRDERFAHAVQSQSTWNLDAWWYDTGNFGNVGLVVRTIAEAWQISIEDAVRLMEPLHVQGDRDLRPRIETDEGEPIRVAAIRMKRPPATR